VAPAFERASVQRVQKVLPPQVPVLEGLSPLELEFFRMACEAQTPAAGATLAPGSLYVVTAGQLRQGERAFGPGDCVGTAALLETARAAEAGPVAGPDTQVLALTPAALQALGERYPRLGVKLYRNLAARWA
jgi:hypothetical protein